MDEVVKKIIKITAEIQKKKFKPINELEIPNDGGIYIIKEKKSRLFNGRIFYIGRSKNLRRRVRSYVTRFGHPYLKRKLSKMGLDGREISRYLANDCEFIIEKIDDFDIYDSVEKLLVAIHRKKEPLLNTAN